MPTAQKEAVVEEFTGKLKDAKSLYLADFKGMDVATVTALRADLRGRGIEYFVVKNTLLRLACRQTGMEALEPFLEGPTALAYSTESEVEPARALVQFARVHTKPVVKAGVIGERLYSKQEILQLAALPGREELLAQVLGTVTAPMTAFLGAVNALISSPAQLTDALERKQQS
jgi:large subunit ribosomal protein L10